MTPKDTLEIAPDAGPARTNRQNAEHGFKASERLMDSLQRVLVDLIELHLQGKQAHWNVVGTNFRDTHLLLDEIVEAGRLASDQIAERMRALHAIPDGRSDVVAATTSLPEFPQGEISTTDVVDLVTTAIESTVATMRDVHDGVDEEDPTSADVLHAIIEQLEQFAWFMSAENRTPRASAKSSGSGSGSKAAASTKDDKSAVSAKSKSSGGKKKK
ncbi:starvation-inducible DNA-binding protein [Paramicrobacterium humi]|uniref:Starvation-inducible DNA-binding protein n=1 Tax=Paramicrobacterium humi TaxID=640635 RepID=A0A1H4L3W5_9MICO|nr:starvation-inducible DNA-binding protein [Microbacterium humi]